MNFLAFPRISQYNKRMEKRESGAVSEGVNPDEMAALKARVAELEILVKYYEERLRLSKHKQFGASSEQSGHNPDQLSIFNEAEVTADANVPEPELIEIEKHYRKRTRLTTDKLPEDLPVEVVERIGGPFVERLLEIQRTEAQRGGR